MRKRFAVSREGGAFVRNEHIATHARRVMVLLHRRVRRIKTLNGFGVVAADDGGDKGFYRGLGKHVARLVEDKLWIIA